MKRPVPLVNPKHPSPPRLLAALAALLAFAGATAPAGAADEAESPFLPVGQGAAAAAPTNSQLDTLELRGIMTIGDTTRVTIFDTSNSRSFNVGLDELVNNWKVASVDRANDVVVVESGAQSRRVAMRKPRIVAVAAAPAAPMPAPARPDQAQPPPGSPNAQLSDAEVRDRMARVAEEIRRRRQMRREALERAQSGQPPAPQPPR